MVSVSDLIALFVSLGASQEKAKEMADRDWAEIEEMRKGGSATDDTAAALAAGEDDYPDEDPT